ncbi:gustatory receptor 5a for trehalose-like [Plodia interpunctella]|uniref:gustatory receptor 5a for trehalose-like n=1 Tax=Plodia interpunctella TaxID=58824 RepID=UPI002367A1AC|nr:gustatory receptor 5a for trehalose-like [Plodia interpunctella]
MSEIHQCLRFSMLMCRWVGFFPVEGLHQPTISGLRYNLKGIYGICYVVITLVGIILGILNVIHFVNNRLTLETVDFFIYYSTGFLTMVILANFSRHWPVFVRKMTEIEYLLQEIRSSKKTDKYCNILASIIAHAQVAFLKSFTDVLIISFSLYLISYFQDLNKCIHSRQNNGSWERFRIHYTRVVELVTQVNARLSVFILLSFIGHIFYICTQIFHILIASHSNSKLSYCDKDIIEKIHKSPTYLAYFVHSLWFLFMKFVVTSLLAANVSLVARKPLIELDTIPSSEYSLEVQRFRMRIQKNPVAIGGLLFFVTRPMLLQVVGSILTYELVLLQFH